MLTKQQRERKRLEEENRVRIVRETEDKITRLERESDALTLQISRKEKLIVELTTAGKIREAREEANRLAYMRKERQSKGDKEKMLRSTLSGLKGAVDMIDTQASIKMLVSEKMNIVSSMDMGDMEEWHLESRAADEGLSDIMASAGITDYSRQEDQDSNQSIIDELMREAGKTPTTTTNVVKSPSTVTTTTTKTQAYPQLSQYLHL